MALAKALGGGFPMGAVLATAEAAKGMTAGTHGSTFGGNPLAMAAGNAVLDVMLADGFFDRVKRLSLHAQAEARRHQGSLSDRDRRGAGRGAAPGHARGGAERRAGRRIARAEDAHRRRRRQCRPPAAAADRERGGDRRSGAAHRARLRAAGEETRPAAPRKEPPDERQRRAALPRSDRHPPGRPAGHDRDQPRHQGEAQERRRR